MLYWRSQPGRDVRLAPEWRNWQTRGTQNPVGFTPRVGSIPSSGTIRLGLDLGPRSWQARRCGRGVCPERPRARHREWRGSRRATLALSTTYTLFRRDFSEFSKRRVCMPSFDPVGTIAGCRGSVTVPAAATRCDNRHSVSLCGAETPSVRTVVRVALRDTSAAAPASVAVAG